MGKMVKLLIMSNLSFSRSVFKILHTRKNQVLFGKGLTDDVKIITNFKIMFIDKANSIKSLDISCQSRSMAIMKFILTEL